MNQTPNPESQAAWHVTVHVHDFLLPFADDAISRLRYLYPAYLFDLTANELTVSGSASHPHIVRDIQYTLYRSKVAQESSHLRELLYETVFAR